MASSEHSDITISCGDYNHRVHRAIISAQSDVLAAMCRPKFLVRRTQRVISIMADDIQEGMTGKISLPDDDPEAINIMVHHLYGQSYTNTRLEFKDHCEENRALLDIKVYAVADKYDIPSLAECAKDEFKVWAAKSQRTESWARVVEEVWQGNEYSDIHILIEDQVARNIDQMLEDCWLPFIDKGMKLGRFSAAFLRKIVKRKDDLFFSLRSTKISYEFEISNLRAKIDSHKAAVERLAEGITADASYDSDESVRF